MLKQALTVNTSAKADDSQLYVDGNLRVTYLTSRLLRVECGVFTDIASYAVWNRKFPAGNMKVSKKGKNTLC